MTRDDAPGRRISDRDATMRRRAGFGELPPRIPSEDWIEENETDPPAHELAQSMPIVQHPGTVNAT